jgi:putative transcriptional regulator
MQLNTDFFKFKYNNILPKQGKVLVSEPFLNDSYFKRSVVLLVEHNKDGSIGFIINKPLNISVNEVINNFPVVDSNVSIGGPVNTDSIHYIHTFSDVPDAIKITDNIYWGGNFKYIKQILSSHNGYASQIRFFLGYSGWKAGQLDRELTENAWLVTDITPENIMNTTSPNIWKGVLNKMGDNFKIWANSPLNPAMN